MASHLIEQYKARLVPITPEDMTAEADRAYDMGRKHRKEELQPLLDGLVSALKAVDHLSCNAPCMSREVQAHFERNPGADEYRMELNALILAMREQARAAIAKTTT